MANFVGSSFSLPAPRTNSYVKIDSLTFTHNANYTTTVQIKFTINLRDQTHLGMPYDGVDQSWARIARLVINGTETSTQMIKTINQVWNIGMTQQFTLSWTLAYISGTPSIALDIIENASSGSAMNHIVWRTPRTGYTHTVAAATGPTAPRSVSMLPRMVVQSTTSMALTWLAPTSTGTSDQLTYQIYRREVGGSDVYIQEVDKTTLSITKTASAWGVQSGKEYIFTVLARTPYGTASAVASTVGFVPPPLAPPNVKLSDPASIAHDATLTWGAASAPLSEIAKYVVVVAHAPAGQSFEAEHVYFDVPSTDRSFSISPNVLLFPTPVMPGATLAFAIEAVNTQGLHSAGGNWVYTGLLKGAILYVKVAGSWRRGTLYTRQAGSWKQGLRLKVKQGNLWKDSK